MRIAILISVLCMTLCNPLGASVPDFSWARSSDAAQTLLKRSQAEWMAASALPLSPKSLRPHRATTFDDTYLLELLQGDRSGDWCFPLLDAASARLGHIERSRDLYDRAAGLVGAEADAHANDFDASFHRLRSGIRLSVAVARAGVSCRMASTSNFGYCMQAMESAVDALRDAAADADAVPGWSCGASRIRALRVGLVAVWEQAQRTRDQSAIVSLDLLSLLSASVPVRCQCPPEDDHPNHVGQ